jgi:hypothetical protein
LTLSLVVTTVGRWTQSTAASSKRNAGSDRWTGRKKTGEAAAKSKDTRDFSESGWTDFETRLHYMEGDINDPNFYSQLRNRLEEMQKNGSSPNHLFYVSTPASVVGPIIEGLGAVGLNRRDKGWTRIVRIAHLVENTVLEKLPQISEVLVHVEPEEELGAKDIARVKWVGTRHRAVSHDVREIFKRHTDLIEPLSLDEAYLDVTENKTGLLTATLVAQTIRKQIREESNLTASAGASGRAFRISSVVGDIKSFSM